MPSSFSRDSHAISSAEGWSTTRIAITALMCAVCLVASFIKVPIFPPAPWLTYNLSGIIALTAAYMWGPATGVAITVISWFIHMLITFNPYGVIVAVSVTCALIIPSSLIYQTKKTTESMFVGILAGSVVAIVAAIIANFIATPLFTSVSFNEIAAMIFPIILPFNLLKVTLDCIGAKLLVPIVSKAISSIQ